MQPELAAPSWTLTNTPPLWPLEFFCVALNQKMETLIEECDAGTFGHVWNISAGSKKRSRELRVFYQDGLAVLNRRPLVEKSYEQCVAEFLPQTRGLRGTELQKLWCCGVDLIHDLDAAGFLPIERDRSAGSGPTASKLYSRAGIITFLTNRALVRDPKLN